MSAPSPYQMPAPRADADRLAGIVATAFGIAVDRVEPLASERDLTAHVVARDGRGFVFKLGNAADDPEVLAFENRALQHVHAADPGLPVPVVVAAPDGRTEVAIDLDGHRHVGRLQSFLSGFPPTAPGAPPRNAGRSGGDWPGCRGRCAISGIRPMGGRSSGT